VQVKVLGPADYLPTYHAMQAFTEARTSDTPDELWLCEHPPVFTQGLAGKADHLLDPGDIPVVATNRGGQVTFHGPGQVVAYPLLDLRRAGYFVKEYVYRVEEAVIRTLWEYGVTGHRVGGAPGIYVRVEDPFGHARVQPSPRPSPTGGRGSDSGPDLLLGQLQGGRESDLLPLPLAGEGGGEGAPRFQGLGKVAALGIKVSRHCTYHGVALNVGMDLEPYERINPCGYAGLRTVDLSTIGVSTTWNDAAMRLGHKLQALLAP
jgi:lipoyl(octanoyl) transferase